MSPGGPYGGRPGEIPARRGRYTGPMPLAPVTEAAVGLYVHFPFCAKKCLYCDFPSFAGQDDQMRAYVDALLAEIAGAPEGLAAGTVFLGGGTPSYLPGPWLAEVLDALRARFRFLPDAEVTMEANPGKETLHDATDANAWRAYREAGVNRVSLGVQSFDPALLKGLGRIHSPEDVSRTVAALRAGGISNFNLDLMFGLPEQTMAQWRDTVRRAIALEPPHLSAYSLIIEPHTPFEAAERQGRLKLPDEALEREMLRFLERALAEAGYRQYEISNWARPGFESRHNLGYWRMTPWLGFGNGAHSYFGGRRWGNPPTIPAYLKDGPAPPPASAQSEREAREEWMFMGLRLTHEGVSSASFEARFGLGLEAAFGRTLASLRDAGLLDWDGERAVLTARGRDIANEVFGAFLAD